MRILPTTSGATTATVPWPQGPILLLALASASAGCLATEQNIRAQAVAETQPVAAPIAEDQRKDGEVRAEIEYKEASLVVQLGRGEYCRTLTTQRTRQVEGTTRTFTGSGMAKQVTNIAMVPLLATAGGAVLASECTVADEAAADDHTQRPCTAEERTSQNAFGGSIIALSVVPAILFGVNAAKAKDEMKTSYREDTSTTDWAPCGEPEVLSGASISLMVDGRVVDRQTTTERGAAELTVGSFPGTLPSSAVLRVEGQDLPVDIKRVGVYALWQANVERDAEAARQLQAEEDAREAEEARRAQEQELELAREAAAQRARAYERLVQSVQARKSQYVKAGQSAVLGAMVAPSTTRFVSGSVDAICPSGLVLVSYVLDSQNYYGAMVRQRQCAVVSADASEAIPDRNCAGAELVTDKTTGRLMSALGAGSLDAKCKLMMVKIGWGGGVR